MYFHGARLRQPVRISPLAIKKPQLIVGDKFSNNPILSRANTYRLGIFSDSTGSGLHPR